MGARSPLVDQTRAKGAVFSMRKLVFGLILAFGVSLFPAGAHADTVSDEASFVAKINDASSLTVSACAPDRKSTRLNSSHGSISYAVFCLKKKNDHKLRVLMDT